MLKSLPHLDNIFCLSAELIELSITIDGTCSDCNLVLSLISESIVSLNTITLSFECLFTIKSTTADILLSAQASKTFLFLTLENHALAIPATNPPFFRSKVIELASYRLKRLEIFLILLEQLSYTFCSFSVRFTFIGITTGLVSLPSSTASFNIYFLTGGNTVRIVLYFESFSFIVAVIPSRALVGSSITKSNILPNTFAESLTKCTSSKITILDL